MTAQLMETLYYKGEKFGMATEGAKNAQVFERIESLLEGDV